MTWRPVTNWRQPTGGPIARLRSWWSYRVLGRDGESCDRCGRSYPECWWCDDDALWIAAYEHATGNRPTPWEGVSKTMYSGLLCPRCFGDAAREVTGAPIEWVPRRMA